jgi:hypothetical protein
MHIYSKRKVQNDKLIAENIDLSATSRRILHFFSLKRKSCILEFFLTQCFGLHFERPSSGDCHAMDGMSKSDKSLFINMDAI